MLTRIVISQPMYFPWVGFLAQMSMADKFVWLDDIQFSKGSLSNRIQVKFSSGPKWMTIPLIKQGGSQQINEIKSSDNLWRTKHKAMLSQSLERSSYSEMSHQIFDDAVKQDNLVEVLIQSAEQQAEFLDIRPKNIYRSSKLNVLGDASLRVLNLVKSMGGTEYITGHGAANYLDHSLFEDAGISVSYMDYAPKPWPQEFGEFTPYVTGLDLIAAVGKSGVEYLNPRVILAENFIRP